MNSKNNSKLNDAVKMKISGLADSNFTPDLEIIFPKGLRTLSDSDRNGWVAWYGSRSILEGN